MIKSKIMSGLLVCGLMASLAVPTFAADISTSGGSQEVPAVLDADAATFSVTVPTSLPISVSATGEVTTADDVKIVNNSHGAVKVTNMTIAGSSDWEIVDFDSANMAAEKVGSHKIAMTINNEKTTADDTISFSESNFTKMDGKNAGDTDELKLTYDAKIPAQSTALDSETVANVTFVVGWDSI